MAQQGGGWVAGSREGDVLHLLPYMQMGFAVVNVEYRLAKVAPAPVAVEDTLCALQWVGRNAKRYNFDLSKVVMTGGSAGGHLALATGMIPSDSPFTNPCAANGSWAGPYENSAPKVAAVINWFCITDVADMLQGPNTRSYAVAWFRSMDGRMELARRLPPLSYVRKDGPAVLTIHGDADPLVPYAHALSLQQVMDKAASRRSRASRPTWRCATSCASWGSWRPPTKAAMAETRMRARAAHAFLNCAPDTGRPCPSAARSASGRPDRAGCRRGGRRTSAS